MILSILFGFVLHSHSISCSSQGTRGVPMQRSAFYNSMKDFTCLDGSLTVPFSYVNDDYCDCSDGSDEPGTAACPKGTFFCVNKGYLPKYIPSSFVNDGICDCCDTSDEYLNQNCSNTCDLLGQEARREAERRSQIIVEGNRIRSQMVHRAKQILDEKQERVVVLENEKAEAVRLKDEAESLKKTAEERESAALEAFRAKQEAERAQKAQDEELEELKEAKNLFETYDSNSDGILQVEEIRTRQIFDQNKDSVVSEDEIKHFTEAAVDKMDFENFKTKVWPWLKPMLVMDKIKAHPPEQQFDSSEDDSENHLNRKEELENEEQVNREDWKPESEVEEENEEEEEEEATDSDKEYKETTEPNYDSETASIVEEANKARGHYESASRAVQDLDRELTQVKEILSKDYGTEDEFAPLDGQCFTYTDREYSYKLCPFDQVTQMGKSGGSETRLGNWAGWADKNYSMMLYDKGQSCWNGPQRSTKVMVSCGLENEVKSAAEPNKCEYVLEFHTPAACKISDRNKDSHDEL